ncbi:MAG: iron-sulfur cluster assembly scaffold protein [Candidatus Peregrinibacteria bacterium]|nr:iron-sulfur cluster assembly scaffold protein [Candidatus Peregrinibacteria bacterium]
MELYSEIILDYFKNPVNKGIITEPSGTCTEHNPLCGDKIRVDLVLDKKGNVSEAKFSGEGCAISQAATSMLTEKLIGKTPAQIKKIDNEEIYKMLNIPISPGRVKCALLGLVTAKKAAILASPRKPAKK